MTMTIETTEAETAAESAGSDSKRLVMPAYKDIEHGSTVIVTTNDSELFYVLKWAERQGKNVSSWMYDHIFDLENNVFCIGLSGDIVGWTDQSDRALHYKSFEDFVSEIKRPCEVADAEYEKQVLFGA